MQVRIRDEKKSDPGSGMNILDPQHCHTAKQSCVDLKNYFRFKINIKATNQCCGSGFGIRDG